MEVHPENNSEGLFGLDSSEESAGLIVIPVPWDVTASYGGGASRGPDHVLQASPQIDLFDFDLSEEWSKGFHLLTTDCKWLQESDRLRELASPIFEGGEPGQILAEVNRVSGELNDWLYGLTRKFLSMDKRVAVLGGDHSTPYGAIRAQIEHWSEDHGAELGILHIDAHADLRVAYQGFEHSHASIMYNVMNLPLAPSKLVQVGIRDFALSEHQYAEAHPKIVTYYDQKMRERLFQGETWDVISNEIVAELPEKVYVSFDIDGLDPKLCPHTGTPVPGGLSFQEADFLFKSLSRAGKEIVGFDLCEVAPGPIGEWNGNVGARVLYKLCGWTTRGLS